MKIIDYTDRYSNLVTFNPNKNKPIHKWYSLIEGYSSDLVESLIKEQDIIPKKCLDPFGGVGTTALTCKGLNVKSISIEASPFFYEVALAKLNSKNYNYRTLTDIISSIEDKLKNSTGKRTYPKLESKTFFQDKTNKKWIFHKPVSDAIYDIQSAIETATENNVDYRNLLKISLASILQEVSNVFKNGKCLSYKKNWEKKIYKRKEVHALFLNHLKEIILPDLLDSSPNIEDSQNYVYINGDSRVKVSDVEDGIDLVITSPPYLNSRDYNDIYRLELWILGYVNSYEVEKRNRRSALTSHVQIQLPKVEIPKVEELIKAVNYLESDEAKLWNRNIPNMVRGYFVDIQNLLKEIKPKLSKGAKLYINVSNSAYSNYIIEVDVIIAKCAELLGYTCDEIRIARPIKTSSQQASIIDMNKMRESIIVLKNT